MSRLWTLLCVFLCVRERHGGCVAFTAHLVIFVSTPRLKVVFVSHLPFFPFVVGSFVLYLAGQCTE